MSKYRASVLLIALLFATLLAAIHSPGQISVDSGIALYEGIVGRAVGWGPTFFAAVLAWLGGGILGASIFVALNCLVTYGLLAALLTVGVRAKYLYGGCALPCCWRPIRCSCSTSASSGKT
jgi:hypothetical protein